MDLTELFSYFHWYGFLIGLGVLAALELSERKARSAGIPKSCWHRVTIWVLVLGILGARAWHVFTDFHLYQDNLVGVFFLWEGGLSIIGAVAGGLVGMWLAVRSAACSGVRFASLVDVAVFGLPFGQAIGRWGNWVNQELYGLPTDLPWGIAISPERRVFPFAEFSHFHPLFLYESLLLAAFGVWAWWWGARWTIGTGWFFASYLGFYSTIRFFLEFLRVEKSASWLPGLSINQVVAVGVLVGVAIWFLRQAQVRELLRSRKWLLLVFSIVLVMATASWLFVQGALRQQDFFDASQIASRSGELSGAQKERTLSATWQSEYAALKSSRFNHATVEVRVGSVPLVLEVVNSADSISRGLSGRQSVRDDGMLFVFASARKATFWMPEMQFDLDMIWIRNGQVVGITRNVPRPEAGQSLVSLPRYASPGAVEMVLEVTAGFAEESGIAVGDALELDFVK